MRLARAGEPRPGHAIRAFDTPGPAAEMMAPRPGAALGGAGSRGSSVCTEKHDMKHARFAALILTAAVVAGCASVRKTSEGWWSDVTGSGSTGQQQGSVYYAASDGLVVRADASGSSAVIGRLPLHARVVRTDLKSGWAYVTSDTGLKGWVDNAQLVWRLPAAGGSAPATTTRAAPADAATTPPVPAPSPAAAASPAEDAAPAP
ncbi:MAG: SH3 domain-containing protein, partial [Deltaproteobacteria bacterium]|nr:SH3 domain-containing protein [Deltaproteobacteria bacterium]